MLLAVAGEGAEPVLAAAAMQALTAMVGSAEAKELLLQHPGFLDALLSSMHTGTPPYGSAALRCTLPLLACARDVISPDTCRLCAQSWAILTLAASRRHSRVSVASKSAPVVCMEPCHTT